MLPKKCCAECHFFVREIVTGESANTIVMEISREHRDAAKVGDWSWVRHLEHFKCSYGVWDEMYMADKATRQLRVVDTNRRGFCFFWRFRPGMFQPAAKELQERESARKQASIEHWLTIVGLWVAGAALFVDVILRLKGQ